MSDEFYVPTPAMIDARMRHPLNPEERQAWAAWEAHVAAGRIGDAPSPAPAGEHRLGSLERLLKRG
jgi:hypothetical protein